MINVLDTAGVNGKTITDAQAMVNGQLPVDVVILRSRDGYRDDEWYTAHRDQVKKANTAAGSVLWGTYAYLGYTAQAGSLSWNAQRGDYQAQQNWQLISGGGIEWNVIPTVDVENLAYMEKQQNADGSTRWVRQVVPLPEVHAFADTYLMPWIDFTAAKINRLPILYTNPDKILHYLVGLAGTSKYDRLFQCPLFLADYNPLVAGMPSYWERVKPIFPNLLFQQFKPDVRDWPGVSDVDLGRMWGTRKQLKNWLADPSTPMPSEGGGDPIDPPIDPPASDLEELTKQVTELQRRVDLHLAK